MWFDKYGLVTNTDGGSSGNDILYTAHYIAGLYLSNKLKEQPQGYPSLIDPLIDAILDCEGTRGVFNRLPGATNWYQSHDDYMGLMSIDSFVHCAPIISAEVYDAGAQRVGPPVEGLPTALYWVARICALGRAPRWVWNNVNPGTFSVPSWRYRRPDALATIRMSANRWPGLFGLLYWYAFMWRGIVCTSKDDTNAFILRWHMALALRDHSNPMVRYLAKRMRAQVKVVYGGAGQMLDHYFNYNGHPLAVLLKDLA